MFARSAADGGFSPLLDGVDFLLFAGFGVAESAGGSANGITSYVVRIPLVDDGGCAGVVLGSRS